MSPARLRHTTGLTVGVLNISFYTVVGEIIVECLRRDGYTVAVVRGHHGALFPLLANSDIDALVLAWLPDGHRPLWENFGRHSCPAHTVYKGARFYWTLTPGAGPTVRHVRDLPAPQASDVARRILTVGSSSSITTSSRLMLDRYDLATAGFRVEATDTEGQHRAVTEALEAGRREVFAVWSPYFLTALHEHTLQELEEPLAVLGGANDATIVLSAEYARRAPTSVLRCLRSIRMTLKQVAALDIAVHRGRAAEDLAAEWVAEHPVAT